MDIILLLIKNIKVDLKFLNNLKINLHYFGGSKQYQDMVLLSN